MSFWKRGHPRSCQEGAVEERHEQKRRSMKADKEYYAAMRRLALEARDAEGVRFYETRLKDIQDLEAELKVMTSDRGARER